MKLSTTATDLDLRAQAPIVFRGGLGESFAKIRDIGYDGVEVHIHDSDTIDRSGLKRMLDQYGLSLTSIGTGTAYGKDRIFLSSEEESVRKRAIGRLKGHMVTASDYEHAVIIIGLVRGKVSDCSSREVYEENLIASLKECVKTAEELGVVLGIEVINRYESDYLNTNQESLLLLEKVGSENLKLHIDTYHMNIEEGNIYEAIRQAQGKICHVHIADNDRWYPGHGHYDFKETLRALKDIGYDKSLAVESLFYPESLYSAEKAYYHMKKLLEDEGIRSGMR